MARYSTYGRVGIGVVSAICFVLLLGTFGTFVGRHPLPTSVVVNGNSSTSPNPPQLVLANQTIAKFSSIDEMRAFLSNVERNRDALFAAQMGLPQGSTPFLKESPGNLGNGVSVDRSHPPAVQNAHPLAAQKGLAPAEAGNSAGNGGGGLEFSTTNNQVAGVDEPDYVKNDDRYAYVLFGDKLTISEVYPPQKAAVVAKIGLDIKNGQPIQNMLLNNNTIVVFYTEFVQDNIIPQYEFMPQMVYVPKTHGVLIDVSNRSDPKTVDDVIVTGQYHDARMIGDKVYLVTSSDLYNYRQPLVPRVAESSSRPGIVPGIFYFRNPEPYYNFNTVTSISLSSTSSERIIDSKTFLMNPSSTLYVSQDNIYIAYQKYLPSSYYEQSSRDRFFGAVVPLLPVDAQKKINSIESDKSISSSDRWDKISSILEDTYNKMTESEKTQLIDKIQQAVGKYEAQIQKDAIKTVIHKIGIGENGGIDYKARSEVPGRLLNSFSMDENRNHLRVATTIQYSLPYVQAAAIPTIYTNVYVLDENMQLVGKAEEIQPGEEMYSTRFMGDKLYLVTFQRVDPFFVIDLSGDNPKVLGSLKLPGYSTYLHPYDETHVIGVGKDAAVADNGFGGAPTAVPTGIKLVLFDVSDLNKPKMVDDYVISGQAADSEALRDHKAFLFNKDKPNVLAIPVSTYQAEPQNVPTGSLGPRGFWQGFYVFGVDPDKGFTLKGTIEHSIKETGGYYGYGIGQGGRSFYIGDVLYTVSAGNLIRMNNVDTLSDLGQVRIGNTSDVVKYPLPQPSSIK